MKTEEASGTCKEKRKNNQTRCTKNSKGFKNSALGDTSTLLGSEQRLMALSNKGEREKKFCCLRPLDDPNTDFFQEMKTTRVREV